MLPKRAHPQATHPRRSSRLLNLRQNVVHSPTKSHHVIVLDSDDEGQRDNILPFSTPRLPLQELSNNLGRLNGPTDNHSEEVVRPLKRRHEAIVLSSGDEDDDTSANNQPGAPTPKLSTATRRSTRLKRRTYVPDSEDEDDGEDVPSIPSSPTVSAWLQKLSRKETSSEASASDNDLDNYEDDLHAFCVQQVEKPGDDESFDLPEDVQLQAIPEDVQLQAIPEDDSWYDTIFDREADEAMIMPETEKEHRRTTFMTKIRDTTWTCLDFTHTTKPRTERWDNIGFHIRIWAFMILVSLKRALEIFTLSFADSTKVVLGGMSPNVDDLIKYLPKVFMGQQWSAHYSKAGVYTVIGWNAILRRYAVYIGSSKNIYKRLLGHSSNLRKLRGGTISRKNHLKAYNLLSQDGWVVHYRVVAVMPDNFYVHFMWHYVLEGVVMILIRVVTTVASKAYSADMMHLVESCPRIDLPDLMGLNFAVPFSQTCRGTTTLDKVCQQCGRSENRDWFLAVGKEAFEEGSYICRSCHEWKKKRGLERGPEHEVVRASREDQLKKPKICSRCGTTKSRDWYIRMDNNKQNIGWECSACNTKFTKTLSWRPRKTPNTGPCEDCGTWRGKISDRKVVHRRLCPLCCHEAWRKIGCRRCGTHKQGKRGDYAYGGSPEVVLCHSCAATLARTAKRRGITKLQAVNEL
ncbi:hypothetical protein LTS07_002160 [Exophiala sideris]|uniref:GIY-YIG domain-containing protein n=1 Tax=Exophiala sideris TaxID=1016849 RepID=A0ABR0JLI3_9EURO|nr:hypothetical protein LTS07_002160 [Exophiala sideris]KAK5066816.1 hypothetical protein LTR69_002164 [Exophiala sideris]KAK5184875.1 hypothetical protein LTR44_002721 [Eurotiomycetes sp. CCFEE 6388]